MMGGATATTITYSGDDPFRSFDIWFTATYHAGDQLLDGGIAGGTQTIDVNVIAGVASLVVDGFYTADAVCVDFFTLISNNNYDVNLLGPSAISNGTRVAWMLRNTLPLINAQADPLLRRQQAAAFQLAVWDIVHDGGDGFGAGRIRSSGSPNATDSTVLFWANVYVVATAGQSLPVGVVYQNIAGIAASQQLMSDAPEPSTYALLLSGGAMLFFVRRRRS
jgi:hypothetical protein